MLTEQIQANYDQGVNLLAGHTATKLVARGCRTQGKAQGSGALFQTTAKSLLEDQSLAHEVFGASSLVIVCETLEEMEQSLTWMEGQLTATLQIDDEDVIVAKRLIPVLEKKVGRILVNGWPTGVEVTHAMVHGGPYPATSDSRTTSVGSLAIMRFLRPVCYQAMPQSLLPAELRDDVSSNLPLMLDGI